MQCHRTLVLTSTRPGRIAGSPPSILDGDPVAGIDGNSVHGHFAGLEFQAELFLEGLEYSGGIVVATVRGSGGEFIGAAEEGKREIVFAGQSGQIHDRAVGLLKQCGDELWNGLAGSGQFDRPAAVTERDMLCFAGSIGSLDGLNFGPPLPISRA